MLLPNIYCSPVYFVKNYFVNNHFVDTHFVESSFHQKFISSTITSSEREAGHEYYQLKIILSNQSTKNISVYQNKLTNLTIWDTLKQACYGQFTYDKVIVNEIIFDEMNFQQNELSTFDETNFCFFRYVNNGLLYCLSV